MQHQQATAHQVYTDIQPVLQPRFNFETLSLAGCRSAAGCAQLSAAGLQARKRNMAILWSNEDCDRLMEEIHKLMSYCGSRITKITESMGRVWLREIRLRQR